MPVDWKAPDSFNRLLAATVASMDGQMKLNYKRIAELYGQGATYDAIEGRFRIIKREAQKLRDEVETGAPTAPVRGGGSTSKENTPKKPRASKKQDSQDTVLTGRVTKPSNNNSPSKRAKNNNNNNNNDVVYIKTEPLESSTSNSTTSSYTDVDTPASSTDIGSAIQNSFQYDPTLTSFHMGLDGTMGDIPDEQLNMMVHATYWDSEDVI